MSAFHIKVLINAFRFSVVILELIYSILIMLCNTVILDRKLLNASVS